MAQEISAKISFKEDFNGVLKLSEGEVAIGVQAHQAKPYDLLQAALAACLHATFLEILTKKRIQIKACTYEISGVKQDEVPTFLRSVHIVVRMPHHEKEDQLIKSMALASQYCSVFNTLSKIADMQIEHVFE